MDPTPEEQGDGLAYVIYGGSGLPVTVDLAVTSADVTVLGADLKDTPGTAVASGDVNADGIDDLLIGAMNADSLPSGAPCGSATGGRCGAGETYVLYGGPALPAVVDLGTASADVTIYGDTPADFSGSAIAVGDVNGDNTDDIALGIGYGDGPSAGQTADRGEIAVLYGSSSLPASIDLRTTVDLIVYGRDWWDRLGAALTLNDINGDGVADIVATAIGGDGTGSGTGCPFAVGVPLRRRRGVCPLRLRIATWQYRPQYYYGDSDHLRRRR